MVRFPADEFPRPKPAEEVETPNRGEEMLPMGEDALVVFSRFRAETEKLRL